MSLTLIQNGDVYTPEPVGRPDVLLCVGNILKMGDIDTRGLAAADLDVEMVDASGCIVAPGFIDPHEHLLGGSGESGFAKSNPGTERHRDRPSRDHNRCGLSRCRYHDENDGRAAGEVQRIKGRRSQLHLSGPGAIKCLHKQLQIRSLAT